MPISSPAADKSRRLALWLLSLLCISPLLFEGRCTSGNGSSQAAFSRSSTCRRLVRVSGIGVKQGVYRIPDGATLETVIKMAAAGDTKITSSDMPLDAILSPGTILKVRSVGASKVAISTAYMRAKEMLVLGLPLDPALMNQEDWDAVPGIGPAIARDIIKYRHKNGGLMEFHDLKNVEGISEKKFLQLEPFFRPCNRLKLR